MCGKFFGNIFGQFLCVIKSRVAASQNVYLALGIMVVNSKLFELEIGEFSMKIKHKLSCKSCTNIFIPNKHKRVDDERLVLHCGAIIMSLFIQ
jgi:hypothetical protein